MIAGRRYRLDRGVRRTDGGTVLIGGSPLALRRLTPAGARLVERLAEGEPAPAGAGAVALVRRLLEGGVLHPEVSVEDATLGTEAVAVVVPVRDRPEDLDRTLSLLGPVGRLVVVDDGSAPAEAAAIAGVAGLHGATLLRHDHVRGPGAARDTGWRAVDEPVVAFVDADVEPGAGWLPLLLAHLADPDVVAVAPRVTPLEAPGTPGWLAAYERTRSPLDLGPEPGLVRPRSRVSYVPTAALVVRRGALERVGGFDEGLRYGEDVDLVWRIARNAGAVRYEPAATVAHPVRSSLGAWLRQRAGYGSSAAQLAARHGDAVAPLTVSGWSAAAWALVAAGAPVAGAALGVGTTAALVPKLRGLEHPEVEALRLAGLGNLYAGRVVADAVRRGWFPVALALAVANRRSRPALAAACVVPGLLDWRASSRGLDPIRFAALRLLDDLAYGTGVWLGCWRERSLRALRPAFTGPLRPPPAAAEG